MKKNKDNKIKIEKISSRLMSDVVKKNMYNYGREVAEDRVLQDFRDGLKPSQRRILWAMNDLHAYADGKTHKCARITGQAMGVYHPHGSSGLYSALVGMVTSNCPVVYGQGNFGSLTDDAAADRYTEAKVSKLGMKMFECNEVAEFVPNYTGETKEPVILPTRIPLYLMNGGSGIGVGLLCRMPSHNLKEIVEALKYVVKKGEASTIKGIMKRMPGPEYQFGGRILSDEKQIRQLYKNGKGSVEYSCDYHFEENKNGLLVIIDGCCPDFSPTNFLLAMAKLVEQGIVQRVNDATDKDKGFRLEVEIKTHSIFEKYIEKHLRKSVSYTFYALEREKEYEDPEKDVTVQVKTLNIVEIMQMWLDWRRVIETKMLKLEMKRSREKLFRTKLRLNASQNIDIIMASVKQDKVDPVDYLMKHLPILVEYVKNKKIEKAKQGAEYIGDQKIFSLRKADQGKLKQEINDILKSIEKNKFDIDNIDDVVLQQLDALKPFFVERKLKVKGSYEEATFKTKQKLTDYAIAGIDDEGKHDVVDIKGKKKTQFTRFASTLDKLIISNEESKTLTMDVHEFGGREKRWGTTGIANGDCSRLMYRTNTGKISVVNNEGSDIFTGVKLKNDEKIVQMEGIYKGSLFIVFSGTNAVKIMKSDEYDSARKNSASKTSKTGFKDIRKLVVCHKGCSLLTNRMKLIEPDDVKKDTKIIGMVGDRNIVILEDGKKEYSTKKDICDLKHVAYVIPLKFSGRNEKPKQKEK